ncbi:MAG: MFS transporter [Solirubrobacterales bacterium]|nr:MFS transporter [Solirubrobacterales bacterium]
MSTLARDDVVPASRVPDWVRRMYDRKLDRYPDTGPRSLYLGLTVLATIVLYYELFIQGAVATKVIHHFGFTFTQFVFMLVIGNAVGALASLAAGLADRMGRANMVVLGTLMTALLILFALPNASGKAEYTFFFSLLSLVEGACLVATPALIRDFSPQVRRATAMAFWTMGPVLGSLVVTEVSSHTLGSHPNWQYQFHVCGIVALVVWLLTFAFLRELSPQLRDQLMVSLRDRALVQARAAGLDVEKLLKGHWRQMLKLDIVFPAFAISAFLLLYYVFVGFIVVYFVTVFNYTEARTNNLANWFWVSEAVALLIAGVLSDRLLVRKPFLIVGTAISAVGTALFALAATSPGTSYHTFALYFVLMAGGTGIVFSTWMAAYTETVEKHNPAATATGLAVWGGIIRATVCVAFAILTFVVSATSTLVDQGPRVQSIVSTHPAQVRVLQTVDPATLATLQRNPNDALAQARAVSELSGLPVADVARVAALGTRYASELATLSAINPATQAALAASPTNTAALFAATGQIATKLGIPPAEAQTRLAALSRVPLADLVFLHTNGPKVQLAAARLRSVSTVPPADLAYLQANGAKVAKAQKESPGQWQTWWWVCFGAQFLMIPAAFLLTGRWSPRKAKEDELAHEQMVDRELERLQTAPPARDEVAVPTI